MDIGSGTSSSPLQAALGFFLSAFVVFIASGSGLGGGVLLLPINIFLLGLGQRHAVCVMHINHAMSLVQFNIFHVNETSACVSSTLYHPSLLYLQGSVEFYDLFGRRGQL